MLLPAGSASKITVVPVIATVTALLRIVPPPESFGTRNKIEPLSTFAVRPDLLKLKIVFAPSRVIVRSGKVNSDRESPPVRTPVSSETLSFKLASRAAASAGSSFTSRMIWVTRASLGSAAIAVGYGKMNAAQVREPARILIADLIARFVIRVTTRE